MLEHEAPRSPPVPPPPPPLLTWPMPHHMTMLGLAGTLGEAQAIWEAQAICPGGERVGSLTLPPNPAPAPSSLSLPPPSDLGRGHDTMGGRVVGAGPHALLAQQRAAPCGRAAPSRHQARQPAAGACNPPAPAPLGPAATTPSRHQVRHAPPTPAASLPHHSAAAAPQTTRKEVRGGYGRR